MVRKWEKEKKEKATRILIKAFLIFAVVGILSGGSYFILEKKNKELKASISGLKEEKETLEKDVREIDGKISEKEKSFKEITEKLNQQTKK